MAHPYNGIPFSNKKECVSGICYHMDESPKDAKLKKPDSRDHVLYNSIIENVQNRQMYREKQINVWLE